MEHAVDLEKMRMWLKGLMFDCPLGEAVETCPASEMRELSLEERLEAVDVMSPERIEQILLYHQSCLRLRTGYRNHQP